MMRLNTKLEMNASRDGRVDRVIEVLVAVCLDFFLGREASASVVDIVCFMAARILGQSQKSRD
jgi:hypothetical protein